MNIETIVVGEFAVNCLICVGDDSQALVIDPGGDADTIVSHLRARNLTVAAYLLTHGHCDHVSALTAVHTVIPAPVAMHPTDRVWAFTSINNLPPFYAAPEQPDAEMIDLIEGKRYALAGLPFVIIETPGHTPGGVCIHFQKDTTLITGDTLFAGSVGRTDLPGGDGHMLRASIKKLQALPDATRILPGHGPASTLLHEKQTNYFMRGGLEQ